jgi:hypothetical protein
MVFTFLWHPSLNQVASTSEGKLAMKPVKLLTSLAGCMWATIAPAADEDRVRYRRLKSGSDSR